MSEFDKDRGRLDWRGLTIVHVVTGLGFGGTLTTCRSIVALTRERYSIKARIVALVDSEQAQASAFQGSSGHPVEILPFPPSQKARTIVGFMRYLRRVRPDGIIVHAFGVPHVMVAIAARIAGSRRVVAKAGNTAPDDIRSRRKWAALIQLSRFLHVTIVSSSHAIEDTLAGLGVPLPAGSRVIHNGCDVDAIAAEAAATRVVRKSGGPLIAGMVARIDTIKDHMTLLDAWTRLCRSSVSGDRELWIIGDGELKSDIQARAHSLGIDSSVRFFGARSDIPQLLGQLDVFVLATTTAEGFGIVLIEAMAAGLPVIASDVPACREVIGGDGAGILVKPHSPHMLAEALEGVFADSQKRTALASAAEMRVRTQFAIAATARAYVQVALEAE